MRISLEQTVAQAEWIVEGDVVRNWCGWDSAHRMIWTHAEIAVKDRWKGSIGNTVTISEPGGSVNGMAIDVPGMVRYLPGEHVVAFLYRTPIGFIRTVGLSQGKLLIDAQGVVHATAPEALMVSAQGTRSAGASIAELESSRLTAARQRIMRMASLQQGVRK